MVQSADDLALEQNLLSRAQQGDPDAIATLLNRALNPYGVSAQARLQQDILHVLIEASQTPLQEQWVPFIQQGMANLGSPRLRRVQVYGRQRGQTQAAWQQSVSLPEPATNALNSPPAYNAISPTSTSVAPPITQFQQGGNPAGQQVAIGNRVLQITPLGGVVTQSPHPTALPQPRPRPQPQFYCRPFSNLLNRSHELESAAGALKANQPVEIHAPAGLGKTALLRSLAYAPDLDYLFRDGIIYRIVRRKPLEDLVQACFDDFYEYEEGIPRKPTDAELQLALRGKRALLILDDVLLPPEEVHQLLTLLPSLNFLMATPEQRFWGEGMALPLSGLALPDALILLERALGRELAPGEQPAGQSLCNLVQGHPLQIVQAAALVRDRHIPLGTVAQQIGNAPSPEALILKNSAALPEAERRMLAALGVLGGTPVGSHHLAALTAVSDPQPVLDTLVQHGLVTTDGMRYALAGNLVAPLQQVWNLSQWIPSVLRYFRQWVGQHGQVRGSLAQESDLLLRIAEIATQNHQWAEVLTLARQADGSLASSGYWGIWGQLWQMGLQAAQNMGDQAAIAHALHQLGTRALCLDDTFTANTYLNQALQLREAMGDSAAAALTRHNLEFLLNPAASPTATGTPTLPILPTTTYSTQPPTPHAPRPIPHPEVAEEQEAERKNTAAMISVAVFAALVAGIGGFFAWQTVQNQPNFSLSASNLEFPAQEVNKSSTARTLTLTNNDDRPLVIGQVETVGTHAADFQVTEDCTRQPIAPASNCRLQITFTPQAGGPRAADLVIGDRTGSVLRRIDLRGTGNAPTTSGSAILNFTPGTLDFGDQRLNQLSATRRITVTNGGSNPITIRAVNTTGAAQTEFKGSETCTRAPLPANGTCTLDLQFQPTQTGNRTATLTLTDSTGNTWNLPLSGNGITATTQGPALAISPGNLDFGNQTLRSSSGEQVLTLSNTGTQPLSISGLDLVGENPGDFSIGRNTCQGSPLAPNSSCQVGLRFTPGEQGYRSANLRVNSNDPSGTDTIFLSGFGTAPATAGIQVQPTSLDFGSINLDTASGSRTVVIRNSGNVDLRIGNIQVSGNPDFVSDRTGEVGDACQNVTLPAGQSCGFGVVFLPQVAGNRAARIAIPNSAGGEVGIALLGAGALRPVARISVSPTSLSFGSLTIGNTSNPQSVTIRNNGMGPLQIGQIGVSGNQAVDFNPDSANFNGCSNSTLQPDGTCTFQMYFGPTAEGDRTARLTIPNNAPQGTIILNLDGSGTRSTAPNLTINPPAIGFGGRAIGTAASETVTLGNSGTAPLQLGNISLSGNDDFRLDFASTGVNTCPNATLSPGETCSFQVLFSPQTEGDRSAQITIPSNTASGSATISVSGSGLSATPPSN